jgi:ATP-dependent Clp protease ATP-binding subunit ClpA
MPNKMERFTQRARRVLSLAQEAAERLEHRYIGTEHLLLGLMRADGGIAARVLRDLDVGPRRVEGLAKEAYKGGVREPDTPIELSSDTKKALELSVEEARRLQSETIGTEHLLLALVRVEDCAGVQLLSQLGISVEEIRDRTHQMLQESQVQPEDPTYEGFELSSAFLGHSEMERFTQRARRVLSLAQEEAERLLHNYIGTEHLLLGLIREDGGVAGRVLRDLGLEQRRVEVLVKRLTRASTRTSTAPLDLSPGTKKVLEMAVDEARRMGHHYIGTEHLLLGLVRQFEGVAIDVLKRLGISPEEIRRQTRRVLQESPVQPSAQSEVASGLPVSHVSNRVWSGSPPRTAPSLSPHATPTELTKILQLFEGGKITAEEATKLIEALRLPATVVAETLSTILSYVFEWSGAKERHLRLYIKDKTSGETQNQFEISMDELEKDLLLLADAIFNRKSGQIFEISGEDKRIEIHIEDDEKSDT